MKKILSFIAACCVLSLSLPAYAYDAQTYQTKADELYSLIEECKTLGINTQYEEIDYNIIRRYAGRIADFQSSGLSSSIISYQQTELDNLYQNAKANLNAYKNGTKTPKAKAYTYKTGDGLNIDGASLKNAKGVSYFSAGTGHFNMATYVAELNGYSFDNIHQTVSFGGVISPDRTVDCWDTGKNGGADITFTPVTDYGLTKSTSLHVVNNSAYAANVYGYIYQRIIVKPESEYEISFYTKGTSQNNACLFTVDDFSNKTGAGSVSADSWKKVSKTFTTRSDEYIKDLRFIFEKTCDMYIDNITVKMVGSSRNVVNNGGFDGDGNDDFDIYFNTGTPLHTLLRTLNAAEKNNTHVEALLQLQQGMPSFILEKYPEVGVSERCEMNRQIKADNALLLEIKKQIKKLSAIVVDKVKKTVLDFANTLENLRNRYIFNRYEITQNENISTELKQYNTTIDVTVQRYNGIVQQLDNKITELKKMKAEQKHLNPIHIFRHKELTEHIDKTEKEIKKLQNLKSAFLDKMSCKSEKDIPQYKALHIKNDDIIIEIAANNTELEKQCADDKAEFISIKKSIPSEDMVAVQAERYTIHDEYTKSNIQKLQEKYGRKYSYDIYKDVEADVNMELHEKPFSILMRLEKNKQRNTDHNHTKYRNHEQER